MDRLATLWGRMTFRGNPKIGQSSGCVLCDNQAARPPGSVSVHWLMAANCAKPTPLGLGMLPSKKRKRDFTGSGRTQARKAEKIYIMIQRKRSTHLLPHTGEQDRDSQASEFCKETSRERGFADAFRKVQVALQTGIFILAPLLFTTIYKERGLLTATDKEIKK